MLRWDDEPTPVPTRQRCSVHVKGPIKATRYQRSDGTQAVWLLAQGSRAEIVHFRNGIKDIDVWCRGDVEIYLTTEQAEALLSALTAEGVV